MAEIPMGPSLSGQRAAPGPQQTGVVSRQGFNPGRGFSGKTTAGGVPQYLGGMTSQAGTQLVNSIARSKIESGLNDQERVNKLAAKEEAREFGDWYRAKADEYLKLQGRDAIGAPERFLEEFEAESRKRLELIRDPVMRQTIMDIQEHFREQGLNTLTAHQRQQIDVWDRNMLARDLGAIQTLANQDPANWQAYADEARRVIRGSDVNNGLDTGEQEKNLEKSLAAQAFYANIEAGKTGAAGDILKMNPAGGGGLGKPLAGSPRITSGYGPRKAPKTPDGYGSSDHKGIDYAVPVGTPVTAAGAGKVTFVGNTGGGYGIQVKIDHGDGRETWYSHLDSADGLKVGDAVGQGQQIALSGNSGKSSGPHLDFRVKVNGEFVDPAKVFGNAAPAGQPAKPVQLASLGPEIAASASDAYGLVPAGAGELSGYVESDPYGGLFTPGERAQMQADLDRAKSRNFLEANKDRLLNGEAWEVQSEINRMVRDNVVSTAMGEQMSHAISFWADMGTKAAVQAQKQAAMQTFEKLMARAEDPDFILAVENSDLVKSEKEFLKSLPIWQSDAERTAGKTSRDIVEGLVTSGIIAGDISSRADLIRFLARYTGLFDLDDVQKIFKKMDGEVDEAKSRAEQWFALSPAVLAGDSAYKKAKNETERAALKREYVALAAQVAVKQGLVRDGQAFNTMMSKLFSDKDKNGLPVHSADRPDLFVYELTDEAHKMKMNREKIQQASEEETDENYLRAAIANSQNLPLGAVMSSSADTWRGKGKIRLFGLGVAVARHNDEFTRAGLAYDVDPERLAAMYYAVWKSKPKDERTDSGLIDMTPEEAAALGVKDPASPADNIRGVTRRLLERLAANKGDYNKAVDDLIHDQQIREIFRSVYLNKHTLGKDDIALIGDEYGGNNKFWASPRQP